MNDGVEINRHINTGYIYIGVSDPMVDLFFWQQVRNVAAHCGILPNRYGSLSKFDLHSNSLWVCVI